MAIYDGDKKDEADKAKQKFPNFNIVVIKDDDIRDKKEKTILGKSGITFDNGKLKDENREYASLLIKQINVNFLKN